MYCPKCGCLLEENNNFCPGCGNCLSKNDLFSPDYHQVETEKFQRKTPAWFYCLVSVTLLLCGWGFYAIFTAGESLEVIVYNQLNEIEEQQITKAYYEYASAEFKKKVSLDDFRKFVIANRALGDHDEIEILDKKQERNFGIVIAKIVPKMGDPIRLKYEFIKEEGDWRILSIDVEENLLTDRSRREDVFKAIKRQLKALSKSNFAEAYENYGSSAFKKATTLNEFENFVQGFPLLEEYAEISFPQAQASDKKATVTALIRDKGRILPVEYVLVKEGGEWKIWSMRIINLTSEKPRMPEINPKLLDAPVENLMKAISSGDLKKAYDSTASGFKLVTPYADFVNYVERFPLFMKGQFKVTKQYFDKGVGKLQVELTDGNRSILVEYTLSQENEKWKVMGMQILEDAMQVAKPQSVEEEFDASFLTNTINGQLLNIRKQEFYTAYKNYTAQQFRESTPFQQFAKFLHQNVIFSDNQSAEFENLMFNNNIATIRGVLRAKNGDTGLVEYNLIKEEGEWKILGIKIIPSESSPKESLTKEESQEERNDKSPLNFNKMEIGTEINVEGKIKEPLRVIQGPGKEIFATLFVNRGKQGTVVEVIFEHAQTGARIMPVNAQLKQNGDSMLSFVFSPPPKGWPVGKYNLKAKAATGEQGVFPFEIE